MISCKGAVNNNPADDLCDEYIFLYGYMISYSYPHLKAVVTTLLCLDVDLDSAKSEAAYYLPSIR